MKKKPVPVPSGGNQGEIFFACDINNRRDVVIKRRDNLERIAFEAQVMRDYGKHNHLVQFYDYFLYKKLGHIVMEKVPGEQLFFRRRKQQLVLRIMVNILSGLHHLHQCGYIHGDILPTNIMLKDEDPTTVKILDFGSALKKKEGVFYFPQSMKRGRSIYKPPEKNPEYTGPIDDSWDLYSTACLCVYLLVNRPYSPAKDSIDAIKNKSLQLVLRKALNRQPQDRYRSAQDFIGAIEYSIDRQPDPE